MNEMDTICQYARELKLSSVRENLPLFAEDAVREQWGHLTLLRRLLTLIREAKTEKTLRNLEMKFERYDLVICDELGYVGFDKEGAEMLFNHLSLRTGKKATIITTNLPFTRWEEVLKDKVLCSALVDRLCHKSYLVNMTGTSYRVKETKKIIEKI